MTGDKFMPKIYLRQPAALDKSRFTKSKERTQKFKETEDS